MTEPRRMRSSPIFSLLTALAAKPNDLVSRVILRPFGSWTCTAFREASKTTAGTILSTVYKVDKYWLTVSSTLSVLLRSI